MADSSPCTGTTWYTDADGDGYGDPETPVESCEAPEGTVANASDCDDTRGLVYPGAQEICVDGVVNDCDAEDETAALDFCSGSGPFSLAGADAKLFGERADDEAGTQVVGVRDVDGDGKDDLLVATSDLVRETATVYLVSGPVGGAVSLGDAYAELPGDEAGTGYGQANAGAGDVDGDGYSDLLLGTTGANRAYLKLGPVFGEVSVQDADTLILGRGDRTGFSVAGLGDVDGDGLSDLLLGAPLAQGLDEESELGGCVAEDEELPENGGDAGSAYLFQAPPTGRVPASEANASLIGEDGGDAAGWRVARAGDVDGDGLAGGCSVRA